MREIMDRIAAYFDADYATYRDDLPVLEAYAQRTGGPILELGCGTGRALLPLAAAGYEVTGVDLSARMLAAARSKAEAAGSAHRVTLVEGDFASAPLGGPYAFAFSVMNTFLHLPDTAEQLRALRHWRAHLKPRGVLLLDVFHPDVAQLSHLSNSLELEKTWHCADTGRQVVKYLARSVDLGEQVLHIHLIYEELEPDGQVRRVVLPFDLRYVWRFEAELLLDKAGFALEAIYGDWDLAPFEGGSDRMILVARRK